MRTYSYFMRSLWLKMCSRYDPNGSDEVIIQAERYREMIVIWEERGLVFGI